AWQNVKKLINCVCSRKLECSALDSPIMFGREYDLDILNIVSIPDFNMGAMENKSLNEFSSDMGSRTVKRIGDVSKLRTYQFPQDAGPMAHPVRPHSYIKPSTRNLEPLTPLQQLLNHTNSPTAVTHRPVVSSLSSPLLPPFDAAAYGVQPDQIIFTDVAMKNEHIRRGSLADLCLDT
ncbi:hypothetical protein M8C21_013748, partial [Ambrosia artemisiifolia]